MQLNITLFGGRGASSTNALSKINNIIDSGNVFQFSSGPYGTIITLKDKGIKGYSIWDAPIRLATKEGILNKVDKEAVAVVDTDQLKVRSDYFKRNGFDIVETKQRNSYESYIHIKRK